MINRILVQVVLFFFGFSLLYSGLKRDIGTIPILLGLVLLVVFLTSVFQMIALKTSGNIQRFFKSRILNSILFVILGALLLGLIVAGIKEF